jgi:outer membrane protein TolC
MTFIVIATAMSLSQQADCQSLPDVAAQSRLSLSRAVEIALNSNPQTRVAQATRQLASSEMEQARAMRFPLVQVTESFTRSNNPVFVFGSLLEQGRFTSSNFELNALNYPHSINNFRTAFTLRLPVFDQRVAATRTKQAALGEEQADQQAELTAQQIRFAVIRSYYGLLLAEARLNVAEEAVENAEADVKRVRDLFESGIVVQSDLLAAEVQLAEFRQEQIEQAGAVHIALAALNTTLDLPLETPHQPSDELVARDFKQEPLDLFLEQALKSRPEYLQATLRSRTTQIAIHGARSEWLPRVDLFVTAGNSSHKLVSGSGDYATGANVTFNVFDAGRKGRIREAQAHREIALAEESQLANEIRLQVVRAFREHHAAREKLVVAAGISTKAAENLRIIQDRYQVGLTTITEVLRSETAVVRARVGILTARHDEYLAYASLLLATGQLRSISAFTAP